MKLLVAAITRLRGSLALVEAALDDGDEERALRIIDEAEQEWRQTLDEARDAA